MLVLGLMGSPRRAGNSETLLDAALEGARSAGGRTEKVILNELEAKACQGCNRCLPTGECVIDDGMRRVYRLLEEADAVVLASPIYFSGLTAQTKIMIDRCQCLWVRGERLGMDMGRGKRRKGLFISVGGDAQAVFRNAVSEVKAFFGSIAVDYSFEMLVPGVEAKGEAARRPDLMERAALLGAQLV